MSELFVSAEITRDGLPSPLAPLNINDGVKYRLGKGLQVGSVSWRREVATSPFVYGRVAVHEVMDSAESAVEVHVLGASHAEVRSNLTPLIVAFTQQYSYELRISVEGQVNYWTCERADYKVGFMTETLAAKLVPVAFSFHRHPTPVAGGF